MLSSMFGGGITVVCVEGDNTLIMGKLRGVPPSSLGGFDESTMVTVGTGRTEHGVERQ